MFAAVITRTVVRPRFEAPLLKQGWGLLTPGHRRGAIRMWLLMLVAMGLETLGVGFVIPLLVVMSERDLGARYPALAPVLAHLGHPTQGQLIALGMLALVVVFAVKSAFVGFVTWRQARFVFRVQVDLAQRLFRGYLRAPYVFHTKRNSSQLVATVNAETEVFARSGLQAALNVLTDGQVLVGISVLLLVVEPLGALVVAGLVGGAIWLFNRVTRDRVVRWARDRQKHNLLRYQALHEGLGGVKDVKVLGRESDFLDVFFEHSDLAADAVVKQTALQRLPKLWLELLGVVGLATLVLVLLLLKQPLYSLVPTVGLFAAAAFKMIPSLGRVMAGVQNLRFAVPVVGSLHEETRILDALEEEGTVEPLELTGELRLDDVTFTYPDAHRPAISGASLSIRRGAAVGFVGPSGAGKSTLVDLVLGLLRPDSGAVRVDGVDIQAALRGWLDQIGYVSQSVFLSDDSLKRNVAFGLADRDIDPGAVDRALRAAQLEEFVRDLPEGADTRVGERGVRLSGGQRQRIGIARALYHDPSVLVLDEATSSLDIATEESVMEAVEALRGSKTLLIVSHRPGTVKRCDVIVRLEHGRLVDVTCAEAVSGLRTPA